MIRKNLMIRRRPWPTSARSRRPVVLWCLHAIDATAMLRAGLDDATADLSLRVVAACLALGLLSFAPLAVGDAEGSQIRESAPLDAACSLLHLDPTALKDALASRTLETMAPGGKTETYQVPLNPTQASLARDAMVKSIYSKLFDELVEQARAQRISMNAVAAMASS